MPMGYEYPFKPRSKAKRADAVEVGRTPRRTLARGRRPRRPASEIDKAPKSGSWGTRADQGVRPTSDLLQGFFDRRCR
jgi:hypothetical protein